MEPRESRRVGDGHGGYRTSISDMSPIILNLRLNHSTGRLGLILKVVDFLSEEDQETHPVKKHLHKDQDFAR